MTAALEVDAYSTTNQPIGGFWFKIKRKMISLFFYIMKPELFCTENEQ